MLWSMAGNLAMVHRVFMGMHFQKDGIVFQPVIPKNYTGKKELSNFSYRDATLTITVEGYGNTVKAFKLDGKAEPNHFYPANLSGKHTIYIQMSNEDFDAKPINMVENKFSLPNPLVTVEDKTLHWDNIPAAEYYKVYKDGKVISDVKTNSFKASTNKFSEYKVSAIDANGYESFVSEPIWMYEPKNEKTIEVENFYKVSNKNYINYSGKGFIKLSNSDNRNVVIPITIYEAGKYSIDFRYSNGSGPWNTDNKCAIRSLYVNDEYNGVVAFPQRGKDEWSDWGFSNSFTVDLKKGNNQLVLSFEEWNNNMNFDINTAMLDYIRVLKL
jgi:hypothetical protein